MLTKRNVQKEFWETKASYPFNTVQILGGHLVSHQRWLTFQVFLISTFVKSNVTAHWVANEMDIHIIATTYKYSRWRPQFHTTVPQCGINDYSHYILQERRCVQSGTNYESFTIVYFTPSFISSACILEKSKRMKTEPCRQSQLQTHYASWASSKVEDKDTCGKQLL